MGLFSPKDPYSSNIFDQSQDEQPEAIYPHAAQIARILDPAETSARRRRLERLGWKF
jgi:hypothetical protein